MDVSCRLIGLENMTSTFLTNYNYDNPFMYNVTSGMFQFEKLSIKHNTSYSSNFINVNDSAGSVNVINCQIMIVTYCEVFINVAGGNCLMTNTSFVGPKLLASFISLSSVRPSAVVLDGCVFKDISSNFNSAAFLSGYLLYYLCLFCDVQCLLPSVASQYLSLIVPSQI
jgi:hypothetical protein